MKQTRAAANKAEGDIKAEAVGNMPFDEAINVEGSDSVESGQDEGPADVRPAETQAPTQAHPPAKLTTGVAPRAVENPSSGAPGRAATGPMAPENAYNPMQYANLKVSAEISELFQYIARYRPHEIELETRLKPFIPDYIPAIGEVDAFLKVPRPDGAEEKLGLVLLVSFSVMARTNLQ